MRCDDKREERKSKYKATKKRRCTTVHERILRDDL